MNLIDRYIARQFLINTALLFMILFSFVVVIDATLNMDRFIRLADDMASADREEPSQVRRLLVMAFLIADLWWPRLVQLFNFMLGVVMVGAMGFTCAQMVRHRELVALVASGQSLHRIARPIMIVALGLTALQAVNQEVILPRIAPLIIRDNNEAGQRTLGTERLRLTADAQGRLFAAEGFDADGGVLEGLHVWERDGRGLFTRVIIAERAEWDGQAWVLSEGRAEPRHPDLPRTVEAVDRVETNLDPIALTMRQYQHYSHSLSWRQVSQMLARPELLDDRTRDRLERIRWGRFSVMSANLLALVIALPFFITRVPTNMVVQSLKCAPVALGALLGGILGASAPVPGVPAALGVFLPVMVLLPVAIATVSAVKT